MDNGWSAARIVKTVLAIAVLFVVAVIGGFSIALHRTPLQILMGQFTPSPQDLFGKDRILVLLEGLDYDYNEKDEEYSTHSRSDVIKVADLDFRTHKAYIVAIPRDMEATLPNGEVAKINEAQSQGGVREAQAVIAKWLGIPGFDRYVLLRINTTKDLINAIGGIDVYVKTADCLRNHEGCTGGRLDYDDNWGHLHVHLKEGMQHLNGDQAVGYGRFRHDWCSDPCRIMRQDQIIKAAIAKLRGDKLNTLVHLSDLIGVFHRDIDTNFTDTEMLAVARSFVDMPKNGMVSATVPFLYDQDVGGIAGDVLVPDPDGRAKLVRDMLLDPPAPSPAPVSSAVAFDPKSVTVDVLNGSGVAGVAKRVAAMLQREGFTIGAIGNAPRSDLPITEVHDHSRVSGAAEHVRAALGKDASTVAIVSDNPDGSKSDVTITLGQDIAAKLALQTVAQ